VCLARVHPGDVRPRAVHLHAATTQGRDRAWHVAALETDAVNRGARGIVGWRPKFYKRFQKDK